MKPVIETHALCKSYHGRPVVDHLNLTVPEGCVYGFLGPNGAGKSTTMKMLLGLVHPTGGSVELLGHTLNKANRIVLLRQTGSLIESPSGYLHLTARENLSIVADLKDVDRKDISRVLEIVHLTKDADRKVGQYSLGMKQRLGIAMALLGSPKLLILPCQELFLRFLKKCNLFYLTIKNQQRRLFFLLVGGPIGRLRKGAATIMLAINAVLAAQLNRPLITAALFKIGRQPKRPVLFGKAFPNAI